MKQGLLFNGTAPRRLLRRKKQRGRVETVRRYYKAYWSALRSDPERWNTYKQQTSKRKKQLALRRKDDQAWKQHKAMKRLCQKFKISEAEVVQLLKAESCYLCGQPFADGEKRTVDHDHASGRVRGAAHRVCNLIIGMVKECPERLAAIADTLRNWSQWTTLQDNNPLMLDDLTASQCRTIEMFVNEQVVHKVGVRES